nr:putative transposase (putative), gypsy type [Tanacetum cinerariifolium]
MVKKRSKMYENGRNRSTLTQTALDAFCQKYHIPDVVHPKLHAHNQSIHDSPTGKIGVYTRFFEFANFRIPLSQFLVDVLGYFRIDLSQLFVIAATKDPSPTADEFSVEACDFIATHRVSFWKFLESLLCLVGISRYYDLDDNVYPTFLTNAGEEMDLFAFIHHADPTKVWIGEK